MITNICFHKLLPYNSKINKNNVNSELIMLLRRSFRILSYFLIISYGILFNVATAHNNDPLSSNEISKVSALLSFENNSAARGTNGSLTTPTQEVLLIERHEDKGAPANQRYADVYVYDYSSNELIQYLVDLNSNEVLKTERQQGVQLPLTAKEVIRAKQIVFDDEDERRILEDEYFRITSRPLTDTSELNIKAFTFIADSLPNRVNEASKSCGVHRCAQLMLYTGENVVFEITPIVNLSAGVVTQRIGF